MIKITIQLIESDYQRLEERVNVTEAFTNDHHFEQMGFTILLK